VLSKQEQTTTILMELNKHSKNVTQDPTQPAAQAMLYAIGLL